MNLTHIRSLARGILAAPLSALVLLGCANTPEPAPLPTTSLPLEQAATLATDRLMALVSAQDTGFLAGWSPQSVLVQPLADPRSGQETVASAQAATLIERHLASTQTRYKGLPFRVPNVPQARYLISGTIGRTALEADAAALILRVTDLRTGGPVAQISVPVQGSAVDDTPLALYRDSPLLLRADPPVVDRPEAQAREQLLAAARLDEAATTYASGRWSDALALYDAALAVPGGETLRAQAGRYLTLVRLGREAESDAAFAGMITTALGARSLGVKFLFKPGTTDFWADPLVSGPYGRWLDVIAQKTAALKLCLGVVGHTSHTGTAEFNEKLSLQRAVVIKQRLESAVPELAARTAASGMGWRENLVGIGSDDVRDAIDRRVEFKVVDCR